MKKTILIAALALGTAAPFATPAHADLAEDFMAACVEAYGETSTEFCTCKTEEAGKLVDDEMLGYIIAFMKSPSQFRDDIAAGKVPRHVQDAWPHYVMDSNRVCQAQDDA